MASRPHDTVPVWSWLFPGLAALLLARNSAASSHLMLRWRNLRPRFFFSVRCSRPSITPRCWHCGWVSRSAPSCWP